MSAASSIEAPSRAPEPAPAAVRPPPGNPRFPLMDALRGIAIACVVLVHVGGQTDAITNPVYGRLIAHLNIGVVIFFVISGFLIYRPFVANREGHAPATPLPVYAWRRMLRILPAYWLALTVLAILGLQRGAFGHDWWAYYGLLSNYNPIYDHATCSGVLCGLAGTWSLPVEVSFYALLPVYALGAAALTAKRRLGEKVSLELVLLGVLALASVSAFLWTLPRADAQWLLTTLLDTFLWFALGMALAVLSVAQQNRKSKSRLLEFVSARPGSCWLAAIGLYVAMCLLIDRPLVDPFTTADQLVQHLVFGACAALLVLPAVFAGDGKGLPRRILANPGLAWVGLVSYGIFLWHGTLMINLDRAGVSDWIPGAPFVSLLLVTAVLSTIVAALSYYLVERPLLRLKYRRPDPAPAPIRARA